MRHPIPLILACFLVFSSAVAKADAPKASSQPNIVMIFIDDMPWYGTPVPMDNGMDNSSMPVLQMPNVEKLAAEGMKFRNAYSGAPQCSPSRVCLQTGQSAARSGYTVFMNDGGSDYYDLSKKHRSFPVVACVSDMTLDPDATTIPEALGPLGYDCAHFGKWHMRGNPDDEGYVAHDGDTTNTPGNSRIPDDPKLMFSVTDRAIQFITKQTKSSKPFYLQISHYAMHGASECLAKTREKYAKMPQLQAAWQGVGPTLT